MSQVRAQERISFKQNATLAAYRIVTVTGANQVGYWNTITANMIGVTWDDGSKVGSGGDVDVVIAGTAKVQCLASVAAGSLVGAETATGLGVQRSNPSAITTATASIKAIGIALENGSTNSVIEVLISRSNNAINLT